MMTRMEKATLLTDNDPTAADRKRDHIELALKAQVLKADERFYYEPLLAAHPAKGSLPSMTFLGKTQATPLWVSSMTGGTEWAYKINHNLARVCRDFGFGMGLGSCRSLLYGDERLADFDVRDLLGDDLPFYANLGIAQLEELIASQKLGLASDLVKKLRADGLIIHVNPLQEAMQPEGDVFKHPPLETIKRVIDFMPDTKLIVKEVGQGMGYHSLKALFQLPLEAVDFAANGGTNFALLELLRSDDLKRQAYEPLTHVGHSAEEMVEMTNQLVKELGENMRCRQVIISGGVKSFLDGYYLTQKSELPAVYGQAAGFLLYARDSYEKLYDYVSLQVRGLELAKAYLHLKP